MIQKMIDFVLGIKEPGLKLSELEAFSGLDFGYESGDTSATAGGDGLTVDLYLQEAPRDIIGAWGRSKPQAGFDPELTVVILSSSTAIEHPVSREDKEILEDRYGREVWSWDRFFYYFPQRPGQKWMLARRFKRATYHSSPEDDEALRAALAGLVAAASADGFSPTEHFASAHAERRVAEGEYDFRSALVEVDGDRVTFTMLNELTLDAFFESVGMETVSFSMFHDRGLRPVPFEAKNITVTVEAGQWPSDTADEYNAKDEGPAKGYLTRKLTLRFSAQS